MKDLAKPVWLTVLTFGMICASGQTLHAQRDLALVPAPAVVLDTDATDADDQGGVITFTSDAFLNSAAGEHNNFTLDAGIASIVFNENIGEFLLFLPGVSVTTSGAEPTTVAMRGFPGNNTGLTIDGAETTATFNGNSRALDLREVPFNNVSRVEITKVPTPDMPASGLGGSINLITRNGFETKKPQLLFNLYGMFHDRNGLTFDGGKRNASGVTTAKYVLPSFDFSYLRPINENLAITVGNRCLNAIV